MIVNPIYFSSGSNSGNGENDWDPTDIKENKEMLDLTNFTPLYTSNGTYPILYDINTTGSVSSGAIKANNTTLILQVVASSSTAQANK